MKVLSKWYASKLALPIAVHPVRLLNGALKSRLASLLLLQKINVEYSHVLSLRWDLRVAPEHVERCWFESRRIFDSHVLGNFSLDWDRAELVPFEYAAAWTCLLDEDELFDLWAGAPKAPAPDAAAERGAASGLTLGGFALVIAEIDALFELEEEDDEG